MRSIAFSQLCTATLILGLGLSAHASKTAGRLLLPEKNTAMECRERPRFLTEVRSEVPGGLMALPKTVLVARDAEVWLEGTDKSIRVHAYQSFLKPKRPDQGRILCGGSPAGLRDRFSIIAPTLIDFTKDQKIGNSFWQFQLIAEDRSFAVWNQKSISLPKDKGIEGILKSGKTPYRLYQVGHNEYELVLQKELEGVVHTLSIRYEALN